MDGLLERAPWVKRHKLDVRDYYRMGEAGIFEPGMRVELIEGEIIDMAPIGSEHGGIVNRLNRFSVRGVGDRAVVSVQGPLRLSEFSEPEPDLLLLKPRADDYTGQHPTAADVLLLIEVANTSLRYDRDVKLPLYARHGVPEVWIVNLTEGLIEVYRDPKGEAYLTTRRAARGETLEPAALPGLRLAVAEVLG
ncbi:Uma2 family endonuclease [Siccirubricoccus phaeus]|uniref:Uma2 family endonuclease n=1 Tax=Siccirubricoccus phaeus TaxID=2595053 RepID=UPI0011F1B995|nr:Uma2 family endonuclease [Siccirubricoccus phaeus]